MLTSPLCGGKVDDSLPGELPDDLFGTKLALPDRLMIPTSKYEAS